MFERRLWLEVAKRFGAAPLISLQLVLMGKCISLTGYDLVGLGVGKVNSKPVVGNRNLLGTPPERCRPIATQVRKNQRIRAFRPREGILEGSEAHSHSTITVRRSTLDARCCSHWAVAHEPLPALPKVGLATYFLLGAPCSPPLVTIKSR